VNFLLALVNGPLLDGAFENFVIVMAKPYYSEAQTSKIGHPSLNYVPVGVSSGLQYCQ
jgi:hypothetical protein